VTDSYIVFTCSREKLDPYVAFIYSKWLRSLRYGSEHFRLVDSGAFYHQEHRKIGKILEHDDAEIRLATLSDDLDVVLGFSVTEHDHLHYVYVHKDQRNLGIGKSLVPDDIKTFGNLTKLGQIVWQKSIPDLKFNPYRYL